MMYLNWASGSLIVRRVSCLSGIFESKFTFSLSVIQWGWGSAGNMLWIHPGTGAGAPGWSCALPHPPSPLGTATRGSLASPPSRLRWQHSTSRHAVPSASAEFLPSILDNLISSFAWKQNKNLHCIASGAVAFFPPPQKMGALHCQVTNYLSPVHNGLLLIFHSPIAWKVPSALLHPVAERNVNSQGVAVHYERKKKPVSGFCTLTWSTYLPGWSWRAAPGLWLPITLRCHRACPAWNRPFICAVSGIVGRNCIMQFH